MPSPSQCGHVTTCASPCDCIDKVDHLLLCYSLRRTSRLGLVDKAMRVEPRMRPRIGPGAGLPNRFRLVVGRGVEFREPFARAVVLVLGNTSGVAGRIEGHPLAERCP